MVSGAGGLRTMEGGKMRTTDQATSGVSRSLDPHGFSRRKYTWCGGICKARGHVSVGCREHSEGNKKSARVRRERDPKGSGLKGQHVRLKGQHVRPMVISGTKNH